MGADTPPSARAVSAGGSDSNSPPFSRDLAAAAAAPAPLQPDQFPLQHTLLDAAVEGEGAGDTSPAGAPAQHLSANDASDADSGEHSNASQRGASSPQPKEPLFSSPPESDAEEAPQWPPPYSPVTAPQQSQEGSSAEGSPVAVGAAVPLHQPSQSESESEEVQPLPHEQQQRGVGEPGIPSESDSSVQDDERSAPAEPVLDPASAVGRPEPLQAAAADGEAGSADASPLLSGSRMPRQTRQRRRPSPQRSLPASRCPPRRSPPRRGCSRTPG